MIKQDALRQNLQTALLPICESELVLKPDIKMQDLLALKTATYVINNFITYMLTVAFLDKLFIWKFIDSSQCKEMKNVIEQTSVNANGFDVLYNGGLAIVAEVKGNVPCRGNRFGAQQRKSIIKDLNALKNGKSKSIKDTTGYYKFMVLLDDAKNIKDALTALINSKHMKNLEGDVCLVEDASSISLSKINIVLITI